MTELDELLGRMGAEPPPAALSTIDGAVLAGLGQRREASVARRGLLLASAVAVLVGLAGTLAPSSPASAEPLPDLIRGLPDAAPSHLLVD